MTMMILQWLTWSRSAVFALVLTTLLSWALPSSSFAACTNDPGAAQNAFNLISNPSSILGGPNAPVTPAEITSAVRDFVAANPQALAAASGLLLKGGGLSADPQKAEIQTQIASIDSADAKQAYAAVTGNQLIGSVGGGAGAASSGSVGGPTNPSGTTPTGGSTALAFASNSVSNTPTNFSTGSAGGAGSVATTTTPTTTSTTTTIVCVVSQTC
jgi:hypothetical protein